MSVGEWPGLVADRQQNYSYFSDQISDKKVIPSAAEDYFKFTRNSFNSVYVKLDKKFSQLFGQEFRKISRNPYLSWNANNLRNIIVLLFEFEKLIQRLIFLQPDHENSDFSGHLFWKMWL